MVRCGPSDFLRLATGQAFLAPRRASRLYAATAERDLLQDLDVAPDILVRAWGLDAAIDQRACVSGRQHY